MAINRELSQFGRLLQIVDDVSIGIGTTSNVSIGFGTITATTITATTINGSVSSATNASGLTGTPNISVNNLNVAGVGTFLSSGLKIRNPANTFGYTIAGGAIAADYTVTLPVVTSNTGIAVTGLAQTWTGIQTFNNGVNVLNGLTVTNGGYSQLNSFNFSVNQLASTITLGSAAASGLITLGQAVVSQTLNIQAGASGVGTTKTINFGTGGLSSSFTQINIGPSAGVGTVVINAGTNLGINSTTPTSKLDVVGDAKVSGVVTATSFVKSGGTSSQFLKADGSVDTSTYLTTTGSAANLTSITGASANTYGNSTTVPQLTVDTNGRITAISNVTIAAAAPASPSQWTSGATGLTTTTSVGIKSTAPTSALDVTGDVKVSGIVTATDFNSSSDINLKRNIQTIENPIDKLFEINGVTFNWIENEKASVGVIAQDVERALPQLVNDMGSHKVVNYNGLIGLLVECIKHQQKQIDELKEHMIGS